MTIAERRYIVGTDIPLAVNVYDMVSSGLQKMDFQKHSMLKCRKSIVVYSLREFRGGVYEGNFYYSARNRVFESQDAITKVPNLKLMSEDEWANARRGNWNFDEYGDGNLAIESVIKPPAIIAANALERESLAGEFLQIISLRPFKDSTSPPALQARTVDGTGLEVAFLCSDAQYCF